jgi:hypothetical protein
MRPRPAIVLAALLAVTIPGSAFAAPALPVTLVSKVDPVAPGGTQTITIRTVAGAACTVLLTAANAYARPIPWHQVTADSRGLVTWVEPVGRVTGHRTVVATCLERGAVGRLVVTYTVALTAGAPSFCEVDPAIVPAGRIGRLALGMPAQRARDLLDAGGVAPVIRGGRPPALRDIRYASGPNAGVEYLAEDYRVRVISLLYQAAQMSCATPDALRLGSPGGDVARAYGPASITRPLTRPAGGRLLVYNARGIAFVTAPVGGSGRVVLIQVFAPGSYCHFFPRACSP